MKRVMTEDAESIQTGIRLPRSLLRRVDKLAEKLSGPMTEVTRSDVHRRALTLGVEQLEGAGKKKR